MDMVTPKHTPEGSVPGVEFDVKYFSTYTGIVSVIIQIFKFSYAAYA